MKPKLFVVGGFTLLMFLTPITFSYKSPIDVSVGEVPTYLSQFGGVTSNVSSAEARERVEHGLPMTRVPYRYSVYFFMLAIILTNVFDSVRRNRKNKGEEHHSLPLHTSSV